VDPHARVVAMQHAVRRGGFALKALNAKYMTPPAAGMIVKLEELLPAGRYYYRFAHSMVNGRRQTREQIVSGAWWMSFDTYNTIQQRSKDSGTHLSSMARSSMAIARRWGGKVDIVVRGLLREPLLAYQGIGTIQAFAGQHDDDYSAWVPAIGAIQIYIPGLRAKNPQTGKPIYMDAFAHIEQTRIGWDPM
jgi:hypothetical protein